MCDRPPVKACDFEVFISTISRSTCRTLFITRSHFIPFKESLMIFFPRGNQKHPHLPYLVCGQILALLYWEQTNSPWSCQLGERSAHVNADTFLKSFWSYCNSISFPFSCRFTCCSSSWRALGLTCCLGVAAVRAPHHAVHCVSGNVCNLKETVFLLWGSFWVTKGIWVSFLSFSFSFFPPLLFFYRDLWLCSMNLSRVALRSGSPRT